MTLSPRERQVLSFLAEGAERAEIAGILGVSVQTVRSQIRSAYKRLGVSNRAEAVFKAIEDGELQVDRPMALTKPEATPSTVRESSGGAIAIYDWRKQQKPWRVVRGSKVHRLAQRLSDEEVSGWETLYNHHHHGSTD